MLINKMRTRCSECKKLILVAASLLKLIVSALIVKVDFKLWMKKRKGKCAHLYDQVAPEALGNIRDVIYFQILSSLQLSWTFNSFFHFMTRFLEICLFMFSSSHP